MKLVYLCLAGLCLALPMAAQAQNSEQDLLRAASASGGLPFDALRDKVMRQIPGKLLGADLDMVQARRGVFIYKMTFLQNGGQRVDVYVDARTGSIVGTEGQ